MRKIGGPIGLIIGGVLLLVMLVVGVVLASNLLFRGGNDFIRFSEANTIVAHDGGLRVAVEPSQMTDDFAINLESTAAGEFLTSTGTSPLATARSVLPGYVSPAGPVFAVNTAGQQPGLMALALRLPPNEDSSRPYDVFGYSAGTWQHLPSWQVGDELVAQVRVLPEFVALMQFSAGVPLASTTLELNETLGEVASAINVVSPAGIELQANGTLTGALAGGFNLGQGYAVMPLVRGDAEALNAMLAESEARQRQIASLVDLVSTGNYDGVVLDYQGLDESRSASFTQFVQDLANELRLRNKQLALVINTPQGTGPSYSTGGYDLARLGQIASVIEVRIGSDPTAVGDGRLEALLEWLVHTVDRTKLRLRTTTYSVEVGQNSLRYLPFSQANTGLGQAALLSDPAELAAGAELQVGLEDAPAELVYDAQARTLRYNYGSGNNQRTVYLASPQMLGHQLALASEFLIGGVSVEGLFNQDNPQGLLAALVQFKVGNPPSTTPISTDLNVIVSDGSGIITTAAVPYGQPFTWSPEEMGTFQVVMSLGDLPIGALALQVGEQAVAEVESTATATNVPGPVNTAGPAPTVDPNAPTAVPPPPPTQAPPAVGGGGAWGAFELGGQVTDGGAPSIYGPLLQSAGMTWIKVQSTSIGQDMTAAINIAHGNGFKILVSFVDFGNVSRATDPGYQNDVAAYLAGVAAAGADAIEVWNEPNLDRDWPVGQINGASYFEMLRRAYPAIKAANPNTMVISGAPAPTGFWGGNCAPNGCDDALFMQQLYNAGGANYMDCIGIHYNEGIISPREIGTDPRDNHYTRYYQTMVNTYANIFQNSRPLCFTELGYLTGEGYPNLASTAPTFAWAQNTTVAQQAQWLAEVVQLARGTGAIRMLIVFNINYTRYDSDPQAGYAIIRPDGSCPACQALGAAMGR